MMNIVEVAVTTRCLWYLIVIGDGFTRYDKVILCHVRLCKVRLCQVRLSEVRLCPVRLCNVRVSQVMSG